MSDSSDALAFQNQAERLAAALQQINATIYAKGAPLGSETYFAVRRLCVDTLKAEGYPVEGPAC